jgi:hypothetical protein
MRILAAALFGLVAGLFAAPYVLPFLSNNLVEIQQQEESEPEPVAFQFANGNSVMECYLGTEFTEQEAIHHLLISHSGTAAVNRERQVLIQSLGQNPFHQFFLLEGRLLRIATRTGAGQLFHLADFIEPGLYYRCF